MQNSAVSFSFLVDAEKVRLEKLITALSAEFKVRYNEQLELVTIRHYNDEIIRQITKGKQQLITQSDRQTIRMVLKD
jgi:aspartate kinase